MFHVLNSDNGYLSFLVPSLQDDITGTGNEPCHFVYISGDVNLERLADKYKTREICRNTLNQFFFTESLYRQCLPDGSWFSCLSLQDDISTTTTGTGNENKVGWTNYSLCWTASTQKIMEDLNQKAGCPDEASEEAKEVRTKNSDLLKKKL